MIKFFRKIRMDLLSENKFSKYLIYAIGEIVLVVIGILIALQIDNLNEKRKKTEQGIVQKKSLINELQDDLTTLKIDLKYLSEELEINSSYAKRLENETSNLDTLVKIVRYEYTGAFNKFIELNKTTFNSLGSTGEIDLLGTNLASDVQKYYINRENAIVAMNTNLNIYFNLLEPFMLKYPSYYFAIQGPLQESYWNKVDKLNLYGEFNGLLTVRIFNLNVRKTYAEQLLDKTEILIDKLEY